MVRIVKPTTPGRRQMTLHDFSNLTRKDPEKSLTRGKRRLSGRNSLGCISVRHRGGGHKRLYRCIDFKGVDKANIPGRVLSLEYDPNRSARIALILYRDGEKRYVLAPGELQVGDAIVCAERTKVKPGNRMQLQYVPAGYKVFNIELIPGRGGQIVRSAGTGAAVSGVEGEFALLILPSGEVRKVRKECYATIGTVSNPEHNLVSIGKAGRTRWLGRRPQVLGKSMNAVDHPHGGGEGHASIGLRKGPKTPWGKQALGVKTRRFHRASDQFILRRRLRKRRKK